MDDGWLLAACPALGGAAAVICGADFQACSRL
jgi:hypothetical protein